MKETQDLMIDHKVLPNIQPVLEILASPEWGSYPELTAPKAADQIELIYLSHPDGSIRWIFPRSSTSNLFLSLYNPTTLRGRIYAKATAFARFCRMSIFNQTIISSSVLQPVISYMEQMHADEWALFTGTPGELRKAVLVVGNKGVPSYFIKIPYTTEGELRLQNELKAIKAWEKFLPNDGEIILPNTFEISAMPGIAFSSVHASKPLIISKIPERAIHFLSTLITRTQVSLPVSRCDWFHSLLNKREELKECKINQGLDQAQFKKILSSWDRLFSQLDADQQIWTYHAHGDFTPWNLYLTKKDLRIFDFELAQNQMPAWYDIFYFIYQHSIFSLKVPYSRIEQQIYSIKAHPLIVDWQNKYDASWQAYHTYYLLIVTLNYLHRYSREEKLLKQSYWVLDTMEDALLHTLKY